MKRILLLSFFILFSLCKVEAQTKTEIKNSKKLFEATWVNKKEKRYLTFFFDADVDYVTVNDWTGSVNRNKSKTLDAYKAYTKGNKLILPAENSDHHSSYCEIEIIDKKLIYTCNGGTNFKDQFLKKGFVYQTIFECIPE